MKKIFIKLLITISTVLVVYIFISLWISFSVNGLINQVYNSHGNYSKKVSGMISKNDFEQMDYRDGYPPYTGKITEKNIRTFPISIHIFYRSKVYYTYTYEKRSKETGELLGGSDDIPVYLVVEFKNWRWVVTEYYEKP